MWLSAKEVVDYLKNLVLIAKPPVFLNGGLDSVGVPTKKI